MAVTVASLQRPAGRLDPAWFPAGDLDSRLTQYLAEVSGEPDDVMEAYALARAFEGLADDLDHGVIEWAEDDVRERYSADRPERFRQLAASYWATYARLTSTSTPAQFFGTTR